MCECLWYIQDQQWPGLGGYIQWRTDGGGVWGVEPPPEIPKALQNRAKLNPIVKTVKNSWISDANTPRCSEKKAVKS